MELESGEYFLSDNNQSRKTLQEKLEWLDQRFQNGMLKIEKSAESRRKRGEAFMLLKVCLSHNFLSEHVVCCYPYVE